MTPQRAFADLLSQHAEIRDLMTVCELLADQLDAKQIEAAELMTGVARLRIALDVHHELEELVLRPMLREVDLVAELRLAQLLADHACEHRMMHQELDTGVTRELRRTIDALRVHLEIEERQFLSSRVLSRVDRRQSRRGCGSR